MAAIISKPVRVQWLAILIVAVGLPTGSLLWFMSRVIANERMVVSQKLAALYQDKLADASARTVSLLNARISELDRWKPSTNPYALFRQLVLESNADGVVFRAENDSIIYPETVEVSGADVYSESPLGAAWREEFADQQFATAADLYERFTTSDNPRLAIMALTGESRCLRRLGRMDDAIATSEKGAFMALGEDSPALTRLALENARLFLLTLLKEPGQLPRRADLFRRTEESLAGDLFKASGAKPLLPANQNLFIAQKILESPPYPFEDAKAREQLSRLAAAEEVSLSAAELLQPATEYRDGFFRAALDQKPVYALRHHSAAGTVTVVFSETGMAPVLGGFRDTFNGSEVSFRVLDSSGGFVGGAREPAGKPFAVAALPDGFPGWKIELYFEGGDVFEKAARRQIAVYIWTGGLVIAMILAAAGFATRAVGRQIRLNSMKNDFIATVSHELKTPLASMRVLVDTLLEGRVRDEAQARQYLSMTARENERLSRMIDNFLTFSRMERNKKAFTMADARPVAMVNDAVESVRAKYATQHCHLSVGAPERLPEIQADHDAIVTVLVNLLDNACKYTGDDKQIGIRAWRDNGFVCFAVTDNGIGLARRHHRRIFESFYQVDNSLARKAEGCGLGLSIVKFIVDAHKGKITVESKPGAGSTFTVWLPANGKTTPGK